jgi:hypothetical protein
MLPPPRNADFATPRPQVPADYAPLPDSGYVNDAPPSTSPSGYPDAGSFPGDVPPPLPGGDPRDRPPILVQEPPPDDVDRR